MKSTISIVEVWLACPYCYLAFSSKEGYATHFGKEHTGRKSRQATLIKTHSTQLL